MKELIEKEDIEPTPLTETETKPIICPVSGKLVIVEVVKRPYVRENPFVDVIHCSAFGKRVPTCLKRCLDILNHKHYE
jgi:hypothetical protein